MISMEATFNFDVHSHGSNPRKRLSLIHKW